MLPKILVTPTEYNFKDILLALAVSVFFWPVCLALYSINVSLRYIVQSAYNHFYPGRYFLCDGEDGVFGTKIKGNCNSLIQGYQVIKGTPDVNKIREKFQTMLENTQDDFSRFKSIFTHKFGYFCWAKDETFNIQKHIRLMDSWDPNAEADERKMLNMTGNLVSHAMPTTKPQWEVLLIPKYRMEGQSSSTPCDHYVLLTRFNHAYSDAISYFLMVNKYIADSPAELPMDPTKPFKVPVWAKAFIWAKVILLGPLNFIAILAAYVFDVSVFRATYYSESKLVARSPEIQLDIVKKIKKETGASVTAILFTAVYSALYKCHVNLYPYEEMPSMLHLGNVMAMFPYWQKKKLGNQFTLWPYCAPLKVDDLSERLKITNELTQRGVGSPDPVFDFYMTRALGSLPRMLHIMLWSLSGSPIMLSNVPGFSTKLKLYGGEMVDAAGFIPLMSTTGVGLSTQTYCGGLRFNAVVDPKVFPKRSDLQNFLDDVISELKELAHICNVSVDEPAPLSAIRDNSNCKDFVNLNQKSSPSLLDENGNEVVENVIQESESSDALDNPRVRRIKGKENDDPVAVEALNIKKAAEDFNNSRRFVSKSIL